MERGVSASKEDVHNAIKNADKGIFPKAFCKIIPDILGGDPAYCNIMHADGAGTKSSLDAETPRSMYLCPFIWQRYCFFLIFYPLPSQREEQFPSFGGVRGGSFGEGSGERLFYKLSPKSALNLAINFSGQSDVGSKPPIKKRNTGGS